MRTFLMASAALLAFGCATAAKATPNPAPRTAAQSAVRYTGFFYGVNSPRELADLIAGALQEDLTGRTMIDAAKCRIDGSCAAPINYLESFQEKDPHGGWTLENMVAKLRSLELNCDMKGVYQMDRIMVRRGVSLGVTDLNGMSRAFERDECAWVNPITKRAVLAGKCTNPVGQRIDLNCVIVNVEIRHPAERELIWQRRVRANDECFAYRKVDRLFTPDSATAQWQEVPYGCIGRPCDFTNVNRALGGQHVAQGTIPLSGPAIYQIRLEPGELLVLCLKVFGLNGVSSSFATGVRWDQDYLRVVQGARHARVFYDSGQMNGEHRQLNGPGGIAFWASNDADEASMRAGYARMGR